MVTVFRQDSYPVAQSAWLSRIPWQASVTLRKKDTVVEIALQSLLFRKREQRFWLPWVLAVPGHPAVHVHIYRLLFLFLQLNQSRHILRTVEDQADENRLTNSWKLKQKKARSHTRGNWLTTPDSSQQPSEYAWSASQETCIFWRSTCTRKKYLSDILLQLYLGMLGS